MAKVKSLIRTAWRIARGQMIAIGCQAVFVCVAGLAPGWADGWPGVWSAAVFAGFMMGMLLCWHRSRSRPIARARVGVQTNGKKGEGPCGWISSLIAMAVVVAVAVSRCSRSYGAIRAAIAREWP